MATEFKQENIGASDFGLWKMKMKLGCVNQRRVVIAFDGEDKLLESMKE